MIPLLMGSICDYLLYLKNTILTTSKVSNQKLKAMLCWLVELSLSTLLPNVKSFDCTIFELNVHISIICIEIKHLL